MVNEAFCAACQQMLATKVAPMETDEYPHHPDEASFRKALDTGCAICMQYWLALGRPDGLQSPTWMLSKTAGVWYLYLGGPHATKRAFALTPTLSGGTYTDDHDLETEAPNSWLSDNTRSDQSFAFVRSRYQKCISEHSRCAMVSSGAFLPTRLLDVGQEQSTNVTLVDREQIQQRSTYVTLSYCWGQVTPLKLTGSSVTMLRNGIGDSDLPKTFQDAILVVRNLQQRYLWIDSL